MPKPTAKTRKDARSRAAKPAGRGSRERELRIIAGMWKGRRWRFPEGEIRPTGDRVRETLFNWLQNRSVGRRCLDLYAGSGALGLEALSRGAAHCVFVDREPRVLRALREQLAQWHADPAAAALVESPAQRYLARGPGAFAAGAVAAGGALPGGTAPGNAAQGNTAPVPFGLVFLDPPFAAGELQGAIERLELGGWLAPGALIYLEQPRDAATPGLPPSWRLLRSGTAGAVGYHLCERPAREAAPP
jgi:16S rRNA (guanine966-N2)-methyltransferase